MSIRKKNLHFLVMTILVSGLTSACQQTVVQPAPQCDFSAVNAQTPAHGRVLVPLVPGSAEAMPLNAVNILDRGITNKVLVQSTTARREESGDVTVHARLINCTDFPLQLEARTHFLDKGDVDAEPVTAWTRLHSEPHGLVSYTTRSTVGALVDSYLIEVREGR